MEKISGISRVFIGIILGLTLSLFVGRDKTPLPLGNFSSLKNWCTGQVSGTSIDVLVDYEDSLLILTNNVNGFEFYYSLNNIIENRLLNDRGFTLLKGASDEVALDIENKKVIVKIGECAYELSNEQPTESNRGAIRERNPRPQIKERSNTPPSKIRRAFFDILTAVRHQR